jgi:ATP-binding cassette subfamily C protein
MIPLIDFLASNDHINLQKITLLFIDILSSFDLEYTLGTSIMVFVLGTLLGMLTEVIFYSVSRRNSYKINYYFISKGMLSFFSRGLKFINSQSFGVMQNTFQREITQISNGVDSIFLAISSIVQILFMLVLSFSLSAYMTTITLIFMLLIFIFLSVFNTTIAKLSSKTTLSGNETSHALFEPILNAKQVLSFGRSQYIVNEYSKIYKRHSEDAVLSQTATYSMPLIFRTFGIIVTLISLYLAISSGEDPTALVAALVALIRITPIASQVAVSLSTISEAIPSLKQFYELFGDISLKTDIKPLEKFKGFSKDIKLDNVSYFHTSDKKSLVDVNLTIKKNSYISFVGTSGSGKTTCSDILLGLLKPSSGSVLIDGKSLNKMDLNSFLETVGYVQQEPFLFNGTIKNNLLWSNPNATESEMWRVLSIANIDSFIRSSKQQLDTPVGDRGIALSGGQRQRIVLAQALIRHPKILVLDEATSSLDYESERLIMNALNKIAHSITIISITHKLSSVKDSDKIFVFDSGSIVESGSYKDLVGNADSFLSKNEI